MAGDMAPDELTSAGTKLIQSSAKFSNGISGLGVRPDEAADILESARANEQLFTQGEVSLDDRYLVMVIHSSRVGPPP